MYAVIYIFLILPVLFVLGLVYMATPVKFKTRVMYFAQDKYKVQYAQYKWFPVWRGVQYFFSQTVTGGTECWTDDLFSVDEAERVAASINSLQDVKDYEAPYREKAEKFYKAKRAHYQKNVPYTKKTFNKNERD